MAIQQKVLSQTPENRETPLSEVTSWVTPNRWFFVRSHFETPEINVDQYRLVIDGLVERPLALSWAELESLPRRSVFCTMECAGNGRSFLTPRVEGVQWTAGAVGHAEWAGVPLERLLKLAGVKPEAIELVFYGADCGADAGQDGPQAFARSLPLEKALHPDTLLATHMNGEPLEPSHGYPLRLIVPGWYGVASVKWVSRIEVVAEPFRGYFQSVKYTIEHATGSGRRVDVVGPMPAKSEILRPAEGDVLGVGANRIFGMAWAGESAVAAVEISTDGGETWQRAQLHGPTAKFSWTPWEYLWEAVAPGEYSLLARAVAEDGQVQPMQHDRRRGGYLINFCRPIRVGVDAAKTSADLFGDARSLHQEMTSMARERATLPLDADMELLSGAGI
jgi:DMSO/TMAO reductase YedYZ molybdopterin-dependent catalytic subunit